MVASNAKEVLKQENQLLDELAQRASASGQGVWEQFFTRWRDHNANLMSMVDSAFDQEVNAEIKRLEIMQSSITGDSPGAKFWRTTLDDDINNTKSLL